MHHCSIRIARYAILSESFPFSREPIIQNEQESKYYPHRFFIPILFSQHLCRLKPRLESPRNRSIDNNNSLSLHPARECRMKIPDRNGDRERIRSVEQAEEIPKIVLDQGFEAGRGEATGRRRGRRVVHGPRLEPVPHARRRGNEEEQQGCGDELGVEREDQPEQRLEPGFGGSAGREKGDRVEREPEEDCQGSGWERGEAARKRVGPGADERVGIPG